MDKPIREIRFPCAARTDAELQSLVHDCPPWAVRKFRVTFEGETLDYGQAANLVRKRRLEQGRPKLVSE